MGRPVQACTGNGTLWDIMQACTGMGHYGYNVGLYRMGHYVGLGHYGI